MRLDSRASQKNMRSVVPFSGNFSIWIVGWYVTT